jgi:hypothetical protein
MGKFIGGKVITSPGDIGGTLRLKLEQRYGKCKRL